MAEDLTPISVGFGTYFGLIFVFLKSSPTIEVPLGTITPPSVLLNLYKSLSSWVKSKLVLTSKLKSASENVVSSGFSTTATPPLFLILKPGLLSISCSPGMRRMVVFSVASLSLPLI